MKKSKQPEISKHEDGVDRIGNLPDEVLQMILSRLKGTEEVIRTSILSTQWRYLWTSVPSIDIDYTRRLAPLQILDSNKFKDFVDWVLLNKPFDLDSFRLRCGSLYKMSTIEPWIDAAVTRKVKLVDLKFSSRNLFGEEIELPQCLVTCGSLEVLKLCLVRWTLSLPKCTGFPALRVLELKNVDLCNDGYMVIDYFLENCPLLDDLSFVYCSADSYIISSPKLKKLRIEARGYTCDILEIYCPKLEFLILRGHLGMEFLFETMYSLKKAVIHLEYLAQLATRLDYFSRISHVEYLSVTVYCISKFFNPKVDAPIYLPNLKTLEITINGSNIQPLIPFLKCLPDLESLHFIIPNGKYDYGLEKFDLEEVETINILTRHLKKVEFLDLDGEKWKLVVARALLEHGNELEEMVFSWGKEARFHKMSMKTMKNVSKFHKASSTVKLTTVINPTKTHL